MQIREFIKNTNFDENQIMLLEAFLKYVERNSNKVFVSEKIPHKVLMESVNQYARTLYDDREFFIQAMNYLIDELDEKKFLLINKRNDKAKLKCQVDKIYESTEFKIKLLKYLQGKGREKRREDIAAHFNVSKNSIDKRITELQSNDNHILGTKIKIQLERKTNLYDSTVHPIFLTLNLSEVYVLLTSLIKTESMVPDGTMAHITTDIVSQLTDYAKEILKKSGLNIDRYTHNKLHSFREESSKDKYYHLMKTGDKCLLLLYEKEPPITGILKFNLHGDKEFSFQPEDGSDPIKLNCEDIKDIIELQ